MKSKFTRIRNVPNKRWPNKTVQWRKTDIYTYRLFFLFHVFFWSEHKIETNERENQSYDSIKIYDFIFIYPSNKQPNKRKKYNI